MAPQLPKCFKINLEPEIKISKETATKASSKSRGRPSSHPPPNIVQALPALSPKRTKASTKTSGSKKQRFYFSFSSQVESHLGSLVTPFLGDNDLVS